MEKAKAIEILKNRGWNGIGAEEIICDLELENLTEEKLTGIAEDYESR